MGRMQTVARTMVLWAPQIVLADLAVAILAFWSGLLPAIAIHLLAGATAALTVPVWVMWLTTVALTSKEERGFRRNRDLIIYEFLGRGMREHYMGLVLACFLGGFLAGFRPPQISLVFAAFWLTMAWGAATRRWPNEKRGTGGAADGGEA
jgi:hypothetical protein